MANHLTPNHYTTRFNYLIDRHLKGFTLETRLRVQHLHFGTHEKTLIGLPRANLASVSDSQHCEPGRLPSVPHAFNGTNVNQLACETEFFDLSLRCFRIFRRFQ